MWHIADDHGNDDSMTVLEELEQIDDDCDKHGIQFVKIDDARTADEYGIDSVNSTMMLMGIRITILRILKSVNAYMHCKPREMPEITEL